MTDWHTFFTPTFALRFSLLTMFWIACVMIVIKADKNKSNEFDMIDIVMENGKASKWSVIVMVAFGLSCVIMSGWFLNESLAWNDFLSFLGVWVTPLIVKMFVGESSSSTTSITTTSEETSKKTSGGKS